MATKTPSIPSVLLMRELNMRCKRERLTNVAVAAQIGVTEGAVRRWRKLGKAPKPGLARRALEAWVFEGRA